MLLVSAVRIMDLQVALTPSSENITALGGDEVSRHHQNGADYTEKNAGETIIDVQQSTIAEGDAANSTLPRQQQPRQEEAIQDTSEPVRKAGAGSIILSFGLLCF